MNSPVFKAMFKSQFKEATADEIPLPEKNASGVLDFLKIIYGSQYTHEQAKITGKYFTSLRTFAPIAAGHLSCARYT